MDSCYFLNFFFVFFPFPNRIPRSKRTNMYSPQIAMVATSYSISTHIKTLVLGSMVLESISELPHSISRLIFNSYHTFNNQVDHLPCSLTHLVFGPIFNQSVDNLPYTLTHLQYGKDFNQPVDNLPPKLTHISFEVTFVGR